MGINQEKMGIYFTNKKSSASFCWIHKLRATLMVETPISRTLMKLWIFPVLFGLLTIPEHFSETPGVYRPFLVKQRVFQEIVKIQNLIKKHLTLQASQNNKVISRINRFSPSASLKLQSNLVPWLISKGDFSWGVGPHCWARIWLK